MIAHDELVSWLAHRHSYLTEFEGNEAAAKDIKLACSTPLWEADLTYLRTLMDRCVKEHSHEPNR
jgi:hypothetical protein